MKNSSYKRCSLLISAGLLMAATQAYSAPINANSDLSGKTISGSVVGGRCPEASAEIQIKSQSSTLWASCMAESPICNDVCEMPKGKFTKKYQGKTVTVNLGKSMKFPGGNSYIHSAETIIID